MISLLEQKKTALAIARVATYGTYANVPLDIVPGPALMSMFPI